MRGSINLSGFIPRFTSLTSPKSSTPSASLNSFGIFVLSPRALC